jgi:ATP-binding cassette subfamily B protein
VLVSGRARVIKRSAAGDEIPLNILRPGDSFGEVELLDGIPRPHTVRASGDVLALRLERATFMQLVEANPDIRTYLELQLRHRVLQGYFRAFPAFTRLPPEAVMGVVLAELEPRVAAAGTTLFQQGDPAGPLYLIESGQVRMFTNVNGRRTYLGNFGRAITSARHRRWTAHLARAPWKP